MDSFFEVVTKLAPLSEEGRSALAGIAKRKEHPKGHILVRPETVCNNLYFIEKGLTRTFYIKYGREVTDWLSLENTFACSIVSFITRKPDIRIIELLEPSVLWAFSYEELEDLYSRYHELEHLGRAILKYGMVQMQERFDSIHFSNALERYQSLIQDHPALVQRVPLGIIASYLGMSQETLSRIRAQI